MSKGVVAAGYVEPSNIEAEEMVATRISRGRGSQPSGFFSSDMTSVSHAFPSSVEYSKMKSTISKCVP
jgi:hypothetical protein